MAKKKTIQRNRSQKNTNAIDLSLPQNIVLFGEQNPEDKKVYISQNTYKEIHRFTKDKTKIFEKIYNFNILIIYTKNHRTQKSGGNFYLQ